MGAADFSDSEQFAPNHPYAPGRSAAIPIIDKPSGSPSTPISVVFSLSFLLSFGFFQCSHSCPLPVQS
jgi:hypothetical protein